MFFSLAQEPSQLFTTFSQPHLERFFLSMFLAQLLAQLPCSSSQHSPSQTGKALSLYVLVQFLEVPEAAAKMIQTQAKIFGNVRILTWAFLIVAFAGGTGGSQSTAIFSSVCRQWIGTHSFSCLHPTATSLGTLAVRFPICVTSVDCKRRGRKSQFDFCTVSSRGRA